MEYVNYGPSDGLYMVGGFRQSGPKVDISVGKDGYLWLKINNEWKRVQVE